MSLFGRSNIAGGFGPMVNYFVADGARGGGDGGDDPFDHDDQLAQQFKIAMRYQLSQPSSTANPYGLSDLSRSIVKRAEQVGNCLILVSTELRPIAKGILEIKYPSDRENGAIVAYKLRGLDLNT